MYIGIITMRQHKIEAVEVVAKNEEDATEVLGEYVYTKYNKQVPQGGQYYTGVVLNTYGLETIGAEELQLI